jgi:hypothetical protein
MKIGKKLTVVLVMIIKKVMSEWMIEKTSLGRDASPAWNDIGSKWGQLDQLLHSTEGELHNNEPK